MKSFDQESARTHHRAQSGKVVLMAVRSYQGKTREMLIIPPIGARYDDADYQKNLEEALARQFPDFNCTVSSTGPDRFEDFYIVPVLGVAGGNEASPLLDGLTLEEMSQFAIFLHGFLLPNSLQ